MVKKILVGIIILLALIGCAIWSPWKNWDISFLSLIGVKPPEKFATLQVTSLAGEIEILIDGEKKGSVGPEGSPFLIEDVKPGQRLLSLQRKSNNDKAYLKFERLVNFTTDVVTVVAYELGPSLNFSEGHLISAFNNYLNTNETRLNLTTNPEQVKVTLDGTELGTTPIDGYRLDTSKISKLKLEKVGYESLEINLLPDDEESRKKLAGYDINVDVNLLLLPIKVN